MSDTGRYVRIVLRPEWDPDAGGEQGLFATDTRVRTLLKVLVSYPEIRYILPDRISVDATASVPVLESIGRFLGRQAWLVKGVDIR